MTLTQRTHETQKSLADTCTATSCSQCGYCGVDNEEIEALELELGALKIDHHIKHLQHQRVSKLRRLNAVRSSTKNLPPETLMLIFHHVASPIAEPTSLDDFRNFNFRKEIEKNLSLIRCASVSSLWRDIILSTPSLWTTLVLNIRSNTVQSDSEMMELCWKRSGQLPLAIDLQFRKEKTSESSVRSRGSSELFSLKGKAGRIKMLRLYDPPISWLRRISSSSFHQLQCLSLEGMNDVVTPAPVKLFNLPQLRQLALGGIWHSIEISPPHSLTVLDFFDTLLDVCISVLKQCPNIVEAHCRAPIVTRGSGTADILSGPTMFPHLKSFTWTLYNDNNNRSLFQQLELPGLEVLQLYGDANYRRTISPQPIIEFFHRLPKDLRKLELVNWRDWTPGALAQLFHDVRAMKKLVLRDCFETFTLDVVVMLSVVHPCGKLGHLPHLATLSIQSTTVWSYLMKLRDLMRRRRGSKEKPFRLEIYRPEPSVAKLVETQAALESGCVELRFLDMFVI